VNFRIASTVLKKGAETGLNLKEIGEILFRPDTDIESIVEKLINDARNCTRQMEYGHSEIVDRVLEPDMEGESEEIKYKND